MIPHYDNPARLQRLLLAKPAKPGRLMTAARALAAHIKPMLPMHKSDVIVMRGCVLALVLLLLIGVLR